MRLTVDIDEKDLARIQRETGIAKKSPAVKQAVVNYLRDLERKRFLRRVCEGKTSYRTSNEEIEASARYDSD